MDELSLSDQLQSSLNMADKKDEKEDLAPPSLQELSEKKSLSYILDPNFAASDFTALEPRLQEILFNRLRAETTRLLEIEKQWDELTERCPKTDIQIHLNDPRIEGHETDEKQSEIARNWSYVGGEIGDNEESYYERRDGVYWVGEDLVWDLDSGGYAYDPDHNARSGRFDVKAFRLKLDNNLTYRISSQLVLYRISIMFGMPPQRETDGYKSCWEVDLKHEDRKSQLFVYDYKGWVSAKFTGTEAASGDAVELLNHLVGTKCLHTYDGVIAGTIA